MTPKKVFPCSKCSLDVPLVKSGDYVNESIQCGKCSQYTHFRCAFPKPKSLRTVDDKLHYQMVFHAIGANGINFECAKCSVKPTSASPSQIPRPSPAKSKPPVNDSGSQTEANPPSSAEVVQSQPQRPVVPSSQALMKDSIPFRGHSIFCPTCLPANRLF